MQINVLIFKILLLVLNHFLLFCQGKVYMWAGGLDLFFKKQQKTFEDSDVQHLVVICG